MTAIDRTNLITVLILLSLVGVSTCFAASASPVSALMIPVVLVGEVIVLFVAAMVSNPRATIGMAAGQALLMAVVRAVCAVIGSIAYAMANNTGDGYDYFGAWTNPLPMVIQLVITALAGPYFIAATFPDLIGREEAAALMSKSGGVAKATGTLESSPSGGFVQVFSYEELAGFIKKSHGIEGFIIHSNEGLVVWHDLPLRLDLDSLTAKVLSTSLTVGDLMQGNGLTKVRRVMIETREHFLFATTLNHNFGLILLFNGRVSPDEILVRIAVIAKSAREFLQWKYPSLPLAAGMNKDKLALETA